MRPAFKKRKSHRDSLLRVMRRGTWLKTSQMIRAAGTHRFSARLYDLRRLGCVVERQDMDGTSWYRMLRGPKQGELL